MDQLPQLFGIIPTGLPPILTPTSAPSQTSLLFSLPATRPYNHIVVFLLPGVTLPPNTGAAVYIRLPPSTSAGQNDGAGEAGGAGQFRFLGAVGEGKESAVFRIKGLLPSPSSTGGEMNMNSPNPPTLSAGEITLGISIESAESITAQLSHLSQSQPQPEPQSQSLTRQGEKPDTLLLAQRIIKSAFNFLASFSGTTTTGGSGAVEVVPLRAFEEWWRKFEGRVRNDPGFLERDGD